MQKYACILLHYSKVFPYPPVALFCFKVILQVLIFFLKLKKRLFLPAMCKDIPFLASLFTLPLLHMQVMCYGSTCSSALLSWAMCIYRHTQCHLAMPPTPSSKDFTASSWSQWKVEQLVEIYCFQYILSRKFNASVQRWLDIEYQNLHGLNSLKI